MSNNKNNFNLEFELEKLIESNLIFKEIVEEPKKPSIIYTVYNAIYYKKICSKRKLKEELKTMLLKNREGRELVGGGVLPSREDRELNKEVNAILKELFSNDSEAFSYSGILEDKGGFSFIKGFREEYFDLKDYVKNFFWNNSSDKDIKYIIDKMDLMDIKNTHRYLTGYELAIKQHSSLNHFASIDYLAKICEKENVFHLLRHEQTRVRIKRENLKDGRYDNNQGVEFDIIIKYNNKTIGIEVETGTTTKIDMFKKLLKLNLLYHTRKEFSSVIIACPNSEALAITKKKVELWLEEYNESYKSGEELYHIAIDIVYLNISTINNKNTFKKFLHNNINKKRVWN